MNDQEVGSGQEDVQAEFSLIESCLQNKEDDIAATSSSREKT